MRQAARRSAELAAAGRGIERMVSQIDTAMACPGGLRRPSPSCRSDFSPTSRVDRAGFVGLKSDLQSVYVFRCDGAVRRRGMNLPRLLILCPMACQSDFRRPSPSCRSDFSPTARVGQAGFVGLKSDLQGLDVFRCDGSVRRRGMNPSRHVILRLMACPGGLRRPSCRSDFSPTSRVDWAGFVGLKSDLQGLDVFRCDGAVWRRAA